MKDHHFPPAAGFGKWQILCPGPFLNEVTRDNAMSKAVVGRLRYVDS